MKTLFCHSERNEESLPLLVQKRPFAPLRRTTRKKHSFSLIELIVAIAVIVIGFFSIYDLVTVGIAQTHQIEQARIALAVAQSEIEMLRATDFAKLAPQENGAFLSETPTLKQLHDGTGVLTIRSRSERLREIIVTVRWTAARRGTRTIALSTLIARQTP